jgi:hypothetical protein
MTGFFSSKLQAFANTHCFNVSLYQDANGQPAFSANSVIPQEGNEIIDGGAFYGYSTHSTSTTSCPFATGNGTLTISTNFFGSVSFFKNTIQVMQSAGVRLMASDPNPLINNWSAGLVAKVNIDTYSMSVTSSYQKNSLSFTVSSQTVDSSDDNSYLPNDSPAAVTLATDLKQQMDSRFQPTSFLDFPVQSLNITFPGARQFTVGNLLFSNMHEDLVGDIMLE